MANKMVAAVDPYKAVRKIRGFDREKVDQFLAVVRRAYREKPEPSALRELRRWLDDYPGLWRGVFDLSEFVQTNFLIRMVSDEAARVALEQNLSSIRSDLGYAAALQLEKLLIDDIVLCWLRKQWLEFQLVSMMGNGEIRMSVVDFWERRLSAAEHRFLSACQALARVRKLASKNPALQVNIATQSGQQVNVSGDIIRQP